MKKVFSLGIGIVFSAVVLCLSLTPFINSAMAADNAAHHKAAHHQSEKSEPNSCQHEVNTQAQLLNPVEPFTGKVLVLQIFQTSHIAFRHNMENPASHVFIPSPPESQIIQRLSHFRTVLMRC